MCAVVSCGLVSCVGVLVQNGTGFWRVLRSVLFAHSLGRGLGVGGSDWLRGVFLFVV